MTSICGGIQNTEGLTWELPEALEGGTKYAGLCLIRDCQEVSLQNAVRYPGENLLRLGLDSI